jgi:hypothetical protein
MVETAVPPSHFLIFEAVLPLVKALAQGFLHVLLVQEGEHNLIP